MPLFPTMQHGMQLQGQQKMTMQTVQTVPPDDMVEHLQQPVTLGSVIHTDQVTGVFSDDQQVNTRQCSS